MPTHLGAACVVCPLANSGPGNPCWCDEDEAAAMEEHDAHETEEPAR